MLFLYMPVTPITIGINATFFSIFLKSVYLIVFLCVVSPISLLTPISIICASGQLALLSMYCPNWIGLS